MSTTRFATTTATLTTSTIPRITGRSLLYSERVSSWPMPPRVKAVSMKSAPAKATPTSIPSIVTTGREALRKTCVRMTRRGLAPLACAVRT